MGTLLHELGHAVYDFYMDTDLPYLLRETAHIFTTEAVAMFFGRLSSNALWMQRMLGLSGKERLKIDEAGSGYSRMAQLIFARWAMVMYDFEKRLYTDPRQDLNSLWWRLVEKYQLVSKPESGANPDWAAKIHFSAAPCYYHNYLLGELLASQFYSYIRQNILSCNDRGGVNLVGRKEVGEFFQEFVFKAGKYYHWRRMIERATGQSLTAEYFVSEFVVNKS
jgi:peptidyl-dipeptidase A